MCSVHWRTWKPVKMRRRPRAYKDLTQRQSDDGSGSQTKVWLAAALHHLFNWTMAAAAAYTTGALLWTSKSYLCWIKQRIENREKKQEKNEMNFQPAVCCLFLVNE